MLNGGALTQQPVLNLATQKESSFDGVPPIDKVLGEDFMLAE